MSTTKIEREARKLCRHKIVYTDISDIMVAVRAMQGRSTKAIAAELGVSETQAQYRVMKAQDSMGTKFRSDYRNGTGAIAKKMLRATEAIGIRVVERQIAPKFIPFASPGVPRTAAA
jgi:DNA-binding Lrp family transcriptional regulator